MVAFIFTLQRHLIRLASAPFTSFRLAKFGWAPFADLRVRRLATNAERMNLRRVSKNSGPIVSCLWPKIHEILGQYRGHFVYSNAFALLSMVVSLKRHLPLSVEVVGNPNKCKSFLAPNFLVETTPTILLDC